MAIDDCLPRFQSFLCCIDIRNGIIFIGIVNFLASAADIVLSSFALHSLPKSTNSVGISLIYAIMLMSLGLFELLLACFLLNGVCKVRYSKKRHDAIKFNMDPLSVWNSSSVCLSMVEGDWNNPVVH